MLFFADDTTLCVPTNKPTLIRSKDEFLFMRLPGYKYYVIEAKHIGADGKLTSMQYAKEVTTMIANDTFFVPKRETAVYFLIVSG